MEQFVEISFDCLPLRSVTRLDIPLDASPAYRARCERIKGAIEQLGSHNTYYLYNARCVYHLTNQPEFGMLEFSFEGTAITDSADQKTEHARLEVELRRETCDWLTEPIVRWFHDTVSHSVKVEFDRYIAAGSLEQTRKRIAALQQQADETGGYMGMYL